MFRFLILPVVILYANPIVWEKIEIKSVLDYSLKEWGLEHQEKGNYDSVSVYKISKILKNKLFSWGYIFAEIYIYLEQDKETTLILEIAQHEGYKLGKIKFQNNRTKSFLLQKFSRLKTGNTFSFKEVEKGILRLKQLDYFGNVEVIQYLKDSLRHVLYPVIRVDEIEDNKANFSLGLSSLKAESFSGLFDLSLNNIRGTARDLSIYFLFQKQKKNLKLSYKEPFIPFTSLGLLFDGEIILEDSTYQYQKASVEIFQYVKFNYRYGLILEASRSVFKTFKKSFVIEKIEDKSLLSGVTFSVNWLDILSNTRKGLKFEFELKTGQNNTNEKKILLFEKKAGLYFWVPFFEKRFVHYQYIVSQGRFPFSSQRSFYHELGGSRTIRGYRQDQFLALWSMYANLEWRWHFNGRDRGFVFFDPAWVYNRFLNDFVYGYGLGFFLQSDVWGIEISFGLGKNESISNSLINLNLENRF